MCLFVKPTSEPFVCYTKPKNSDWQLYDKITGPFLNDCLYNFKVVHALSFFLLLLGRSLHLCCSGNNTFPLMSIVRFATIPMYFAVVF